MSDIVEVVVNHQIKIDGPLSCSVDCPYLGLDSCILFDCKLTKTRSGRYKRSKDCRNAERILVGIKEVAKKINDAKKSGRI